MSESTLPPPPVPIARVLAAGPRATTFVERRELAALPWRQAYWFAWAGAYPATSVLGD